ncbi:MAG: HisA/HisF-related TIM barrel protein, partial [Acidimicrobiales bacterium]
MNLYAAIDLLGGRCVRLHQGDYDRATDYGDDPVGQARRFAADGAPWIHVVDLDGARRGEPVNRDVIGRIAAAVDIPVQVGGGVRSRPDAEALWAAGVARVVMGTAALEDPDLVAALVPDGAVAVGLDARGRELAVRGWVSAAGVDLLEAVARFSALGVAALVVTEIGRDGTLDGPDLTGLSSVL